MKVLVFVLLLVAAGCTWVAWFSTAGWWPEAKNALTFFYAGVFFYIGSRLVQSDPR